MSLAIINFTKLVSYEDPTKPVLMNLADAYTTEKKTFDFSFKLMLMI